MDAEVFSQPTVVAAIEANYVPVKINVEYFPATARQYGITALPTTVILAPTRQGEALDSMRGKAEAGEYVARLNQVAAAVKQRQQPLLAQIPAGPAQPDQAIPLHSPPAQPEAMARSVVPGVPSPSAGLPADGMPLTNTVPAAVAPRIAAEARGAEFTNPAAPAPVQWNGQTVATTPEGISGAPMMASRGSTPPITASALPAGLPPLGLDGFCPVRLSEMAAWKRGDPRWGARHRGRTYLFAGLEEQQKFLADPDRYAPMHSGEDIVLAVDLGRSVQGIRGQGVAYHGRVYLFAEEATRVKFTQNPQFYAEQALQAVRGATENAPRMR